jgi:hypothetical protein
VAVTCGHNPANCGCWETSDGYGPAAAPRPERLRYELPFSLVDKAPLGTAIVEECVQLAQMLCEKNAAYGNSATEPARVFSKMSAEETLLVKIDDKLSRIAKGDGSGDEDAVLDLIGYLVLLRIARRK